VTRRPSAVPPSKDGMFVVRRHVILAWQYGDLDKAPDWIWPITKEPLRDGTLPVLSADGVAAALPGDWITSIGGVFCDKVFHRLYKPF